MTTDIVDLLNGSGSVDVSQYTSAEKILEYHKSHADSTTLVYASLTSTERNKCSLSLCKEKCSSSLLYGIVNTNGKVSKDLSTDFVAPVILPNSNSVKQAYKAVEHKSPAETIIQQPTIPVHVPNSEEEVKSNSKRGNAVPIVADKAVKSKKTSTVTSQGDKKEDGKNKAQKLWDTAENNTGTVVKKAYKDKTYMDEDGFIVTEKVAEFKKQAVKDVPLLSSKPNISDDLMHSSASKKPKKQTNLLGFFHKKTIVSSGPGLEVVAPMMANPITTPTLSPSTLTPTAGIRPTLNPMTSHDVTMLLNQLHKPTSSVAPTSTPSPRHELLSMFDRQNSFSTGNTPNTALPSISGAPTTALNSFFEDLNTPALLRMPSISSPLLTNTTPVSVPQFTEADNGTAHEKSNDHRQFLEAAARNAEQITLSASPAETASLFRRKRKMRNSAEQGANRSAVGKSNGLKSVQSAPQLVTCRKGVMIGSSAKYRLNQHLHRRSGVDKAAIEGGANRPLVVSAMVDEARSRQHGDLTRARQALMPPKPIDLPRSSEEALRTIGQEVVTPPPVQAHAGVTNGAIEAGVPSDSYSQTKARPILQSMLGAPQPKMMRNTKPTTLRLVPAEVSTKALVTTPIARKINRRSKAQSVRFRNKMREEKREKEQRRVKNENDSLLERKYETMRMLVALRDQLQRQPMAKIGDHIVEMQDVGGQHFAPMNVSDALSVAISVLDGQKPLDEVGDGQSAESVSLTQVTNPDNK